MSTEKIIEQIESNVQAEVIRSGNKFIDADILLQYLDGIKNGVDVQLEVQKDSERFDHEKQVEKDRRSTKIILSSYESLCIQSIEMFKAVIAMGQAAIKSVILINGAAAVALLAFMGNVMIKQSNNDISKMAASALTLFACGALWGAISSGLTYITQMLYGFCYSADAQTIIKNFDSKEPKCISNFTTRKIIAYSVQLLAMAATGIAYYLFYLGINEFTGKL